MTKTQKRRLGEWALGLLCCAALLSVAGCKTATAANNQPAAAQEEPAAPPIEANEKQIPPPETAASAAKAEASEVIATTEAQECAPKDGPLPRAYVHSKVAAMEESLAPLNAVPTGSK